MYIFTSRLGFLFCYFYFPLFLFSFCFLTISFDLSFRSLCHTACNTMISIDLWRARIGLHSNRRFSKISCCLLDSIWQSATALAFSTILACVISILLIIGGIEINPGPITPNHEMHYEGNPLFQ